MSNKLPIESLRGKILNNLDNGIPNEPESLIEWCHYKMNKCSLKKNKNRPTRRKHPISHYKKIIEIINNMSVIEGTGLVSEVYYEALEFRKRKELSNE